MPSVQRVYSVAYSHISSILKFKIPGLTDHSKCLDRQCNGQQISKHTRMWVTNKPINQDNKNNTRHYRDQFRIINLIWRIFWVAILTGSYTIVALIVPQAWIVLNFSFSLSTILLLFTIIQHPHFHHTMENKAMFLALPASNLFEY